jgi:hypothetical protein
MGQFYVALIHYPVYNRRGEVVATAITNLDIHDIARAARTYKADGFLVVNPLHRQRWLLNRILEHWKRGYGAVVHPNRKDAFDNVHAMETLEDALDWIASRCGRRPLVVATTAKSGWKTSSYEEVRQLIERGDSPVLLLFGTGWGLTREIIESADYVLRPIMEGAPYNHLSVRSAAAIILDRLLGDRLEGEISVREEGSGYVLAGEDRKGADAC